MARPATASAFPNSCLATYLLPGMWTRGMLRANLPEVRSVSLFQQALQRFVEAINFQNDE